MRPSQQTSGIQGFPSAVEWAVEEVGDEVVQAGGIQGWRMLWQVKGLYALPVETEMRFQLDTELRQLLTHLEARFTPVISRFIEAGL